MAPATASATKRMRRQSSGLVFNPGPATVVECVRSPGKAERRFSVATGAGGKQTLMPAEVEAPEETQEIETVAGQPPTEAAPTEMVVEQTLESPLESPSEVFARFLSSDSIKQVYSSFGQLLRHCEEAEADGRTAASTTGQVAAEDTPVPPYCRFRQVLGGALPWRARSVWTLLDTRLHGPEYKEAPLKGKHAVICGAGPCGIRTALELVMLHADVTVLEKRAPVDACGRINRVHLWEWCKQDLLGWGAKIFDPPGGAFGGDNDFCHIGLGELQLLLLKNALLLGTRFLFRAEAVQVKDGELLLKDGQRLPCDMLVLASGANSQLSESVGLRSVALGLRGKGSAIGVVANFVHGRDARQMALRQFAWARQFNMPLFARLEKETAMDLENIVYYKGQSHHYMVMTPTKKSLLRNSVLREGRPAGQRLLHGSNVDVQRLGCMVQGIAAFFGLPTELCSTQGAMIFDFSGIRRLEAAATVADGGVLVCAVGDALLEPFWPEGLGIMRGFMSALDAAAAAVAAAKGSGPQAGIQLLATTYNVLKSVSAQTASQFLQKDPRRYRLQPKSRYVFSHG